MLTLPWLGVYLGKIPSAAGAMVAFQENARRLAKERLERGSETRDLYHYLVSSEQTVVVPQACDSSDDFDEDSWEEETACDENELTPRTRGDMAACTAGHVVLALHVTFICDRSRMLRLMFTSLYLRLGFILPIIMSPACLTMYSPFHVPLYRTPKAFPDVYMFVTSINASVVVSTL